MRRDNKCYPAFKEASGKTLRASAAAKGFWRDQGADTLHRCAVYDRRISRKAGYLIEAETYVHGVSLKPSMLHKKL